MTYHRITQYWFNCDGKDCQSNETFDGHSLVDALRYARNAGWAIGKKHFCVVCRKRKKVIRVVLS